MTLISTAGLPEVRIDPFALAGAAAGLKAQASRADGLGDEVVSTWNRLPEHYDAPETPDLLSKMSPVSQAATDLGATLVRVADIMTVLAEALSGAKARLEALRAEIGQHHRSVLSFRMNTAEDYGYESTDEAWGPGQYARNSELIGEREMIRMLIEQALEEARNDLSAIDDLPFTVSGLAAGGVAAAAPGMWSAQQTAFTTELALAVLGQLDHGDTDAIRALLAQHPDWIDLLRDHPPGPAAVTRWWTGLGSEAAMAALVAGAPVIIGSLGGVPPLARVEANKHNAQRRLDELEGVLAGARRSLGDLDLDVSKTPYNPTLERERQYLQKVVDGEVQLYLYDPEHKRIVEMIGTPSQQTTTALTFVPGTFTTLDSFYKGEIQQVSDWMHGRDPAGTVAFVWKGTEFPGDDPTDTTLIGINEANDQQQGLTAGQILAGFQQELLTDPHLAAARQDAMGYSWGLSAVTSSEVAGARYRQIHSLAGAWMPEEWRPSPHTDYYHWSYRDFLSIAQDLGLVGSGRNPDITPAFDSTVYERDGDFDLYLPEPGSADTPVAAPPIVIPMTTQITENHTLIASSAADNATVLEAVYGKMIE